MAAADRAAVPRTLWLPAGPDAPTGVGTLAADLFVPTARSVGEPPAGARDLPARRGHEPALLRPRRGPERGIGIVLHGPPSVGPRVSRPHRGPSRGGRQRCSRRRLDPHGTRRRRCDRPCCRPRRTGPPGRLARPDRCRRRDARVDRGRAQRRRARDLLSAGSPRDPSGGRPARVRRRRPPRPPRRRRAGLCRRSRGHPAPHRRPHPGSFRPTVPARHHQPFGAPEPPRHRRRRLRGHPGRRRFVALDRGSHLDDPGCRVARSSTASMSPSSSGWAATTSPGPPSRCRRRSIAAPTSPCSSSPRRATTTTSRRTG